MAQGPKVVNPDRQIDCTGLFCPLPILRTSEAMTQMRAGEVLEMLSDDPASDADVRRWAQRAGHELLEAARSGAVFRFVLRKRR
jgi:tRNA 2-thiouridine synthesizing protein A